jgi:hypothetical protein
MQDARDKIIKWEITLMSILLIFAQVPGLPIPPLPPGFLWLAVTAGGLVFGISKLIESLKRRSGEDHSETRTTSPRRSSQYETVSEDIEAKLRKLASLRGQNLITEEEYRQKRQEIISKW